jgi:hypothetical protein
MQLKVPVKPLILVLLLLETFLPAGLQNARASEFELSVDAAEQLCEVDSDCALVYDRCDSCSCGIGVNRKFQDSYSEKLERLCERYDGAHCDKICAPAGLKCIDARCVVSFAGEETP